MGTSRALYINYIVTQVRTGSNHKPVTVAGFLARTDAIEFAAEWNKAFTDATFEVVQIKLVRVEIEDA